MIKNRAICLFFFLTLLVCTHAQTDNTFVVKGKVVELANNEGIPYVSVGILKMPTTGKVNKVQIADNDGSFSFSLDKAEYLIYFTAVGFEGKYLPVVAKNVKNNVLDMGVIKMSVAENVLNEVVIKPLVSISSSEVIYNLDQDPDRETSTMHQILTKVPMIMRTPENRLYIEEEGKTFLVVRNGKEDALLSGKSIDHILATLPAKAFASVQIMLAPPGRYGEYDYVLNINSDKTNQLIGIIGLSNGNFNAMGGVMNIRQEAVSSYDKLRFSVEGGLGNTNAPSSKEYIEQNNLKNDVLSIQNKKSQSTGEMYGTDAHFSYDLAKQHFLTWNVGYEERYSRTRSTLNSINTQSSISKEYTSSGIEKGETKNIVASLNYQYDFAKPQRILNAVYGFLRSPNSNLSQTDLEGEYPEYMTPVSSDGNSKNTQHALQIHYNDPLTSTLDLESGMGYIYRSNRDYSFYDLGQGLPDSYHSIEREQNITNGYVRLHYRTKKLSISAQLKADYLNDGSGTLIEKGVDDKERISETGLNIMPEIQLNLMFPKKKISRLNVRYLSSNYRPMIQQLSTKIDYSNPNYLVKGNPELKQYREHTLRLSAPYKKVVLRLSGTYGSNPVSAYWMQDEQGRMVQTYTNYGSKKSILGGASYPLRIKKASVNLSTAIFYSKSISKAKETSENMNVYASFLGSYPITRFFHVSANGTYNHNFFTGLYGVQMQAFVMSLGVSYRTKDDRLNIRLNYNNVTKLNRKQTYEINTPDMTMYQESSQRYLPISLSIRYTIGAFQTRVKSVRTTRKGVVIDDYKQDGD